jgi:hypothetical protein
VNYRDISFNCILYSLRKYCYISNKYNPSRVYVKNSWSLVKYIIKVENLEVGISSSSEKRLSGGFIKEIIIFGWISKEYNTQDQFMLEMWM